MDSRVIESRREYTHQSRRDAHINLDEICTQSSYNLVEITHILHTFTSRFIMQSIIDNQVQNEYLIRYFRPYTQDWAMQSFKTEKEAQSMIQFYRSCGSPAELVIW